MSDNIGLSKGQREQKTKNLRSLDSFRFMGMSLKKLVSFLPKDGCEIIANQFEEKFAKNK